MITDGEDPGVFTLHAPEGIIISTHELDCTLLLFVLEVLGPIPHPAGLKKELDFLPKSADLSAPSHAFHCTAVKVRSHWHCHCYFENVFRLEEAAVERITDAHLACFSVSSRRKIFLHCRHDNQHIPGVRLLLSLI